jgi:hypothetical protein
MKRMADGANILTVFRADIAFRVRLRYNAFVRSGHIR